MPQMIKHSQLFWQRVLRAYSTVLLFIIIDGAQIYRLNMFVLNRLWLGYIVVEEHWI